MTDGRFEVRTILDAGGNENGLRNAMVNKQGMLVVMDFYTHMAMMGAAYQVRAGVLSAPLVGDVVITDTAAEYCVDGIAGTMIMPVYQNISINLGTGTLHEYATKAVNAVSTAGTAFVPLPLRNLGSGGATAATAASKGASARVDAAGTVTVSADAVTTTRQLWSASNPVAVGAGNESTTFEWVPRMPAPLSGPVCLYTQIAATGTGPSYFANLDFLVVPPSAFF